MYLKSIDVQGFKSFANKILFEFHNGITGIVGPNGSGKSNVADAVRWVLGEQSAKQLRGGNMQDVIFSGTETRKPLGFAAVAITLDNSDHKLDIEYEEVTVTRRLYRSGESEYLLNGTACRLKDIQELFYDTGIGKEGYSIIGQGQIDKILSGKPEERRELFDEAAGIVKFKRRKNTALKKLNEEQQNLVRVSDILTELTRQIEPLREQSEVARVYLKKKEELRILDVNMFLVDLQKNKEQLEELNQKYSIADGDLKETTRAFEQTKQEYEDLEQEIAKLEERIQDAKEQANQNALSKQQLENQISILKEQINTAVQKGTYFQSRLQELNEELERRGEEEEGYRQEAKELAVQIEEVKAKRDLEEQTLQQVTRELESCSQKLNDARNESFQILSERSATKGKMQRYDAMLEQINIRKAELNQRLLKMENDKISQTGILQQHQEAYAGIRDALHASLEKQKCVEEEARQLGETIQEQNRQLEIGQSAYHREASRLESLENITERYEGYNNSIRKVMDQRDKNPGLKGVVADLIKTPKKYEVAIETALGGSIQNIVTDNESTAKYMIEFLKRSRFGRATFLPLTHMRAKEFSNAAARGEVGVIGVASSLVETQNEFLGLAGQLLGKTLVVDTIDHAVAIGNKYRHSLRMVTLDGELLSPGGSMTGGAFKNNSNLLGRRREIEELTRSVKQLKKEMDAMQLDVEENRRLRNAKRDQLVGLNDQIQKQTIEKNTIKLQMDQAEGQITQVQNDSAKLQGETIQIKDQIAEIKEAREELEQQLTQFAERETRQETLAAQSEQELDQLQVREEEYKKHLENIHVEYAGLQQKETFLQEHKNRLDHEKTGIMDSIRQIEEESLKGDDDIKKKEGDIQEIKATIEAASIKGQEEERQIQEYLREKEEMAGGHRSFFEKRDELSQHMNRMDKECFRLLNQKEKLEEAQELQINYMWEEYELTPGGAAQLKLQTQLDRPQMKKTIAGLKEDIRKLGAVNVNAIEDFKNLQERHSFLETQHSDLVEAETTLKQIIAELDVAMRKQFSEKFEEIRREFDQVFKQLFGGGKGTLALMEEEDVLEAGIQIISQPPGKKLQNMMQLSGGEKALTAISLLFAIQNLKPSPFCLLDEIEAALDDSNVTRFAKYLGKLTKNTQFIIITHRRGTMVAADRLYGITMQEKGVSTLVSVNLIEHDLDK